MVGLENRVQKVSVVTVNRFVCSFEGENVCVFFSCHFGILDSDVEGVRVYMKCVLVIGYWLKSTRPSSSQHWLHCDHYVRYDRLRWCRRSMVADPFSPFVFVPPSIYSSDFVSMQPTKNSRPVSVLCGDYSFPYSQFSWTQFDRPTFESPPANTSNEKIVFFFHFHFHLLNLHFKQDIWIEEKESYFSPIK